jgi:hypothetical protein
MSKPARLVSLTLAILALAAGWYLFRPERAFLDRTVSEAAPEPDATVLLAGDFEPREHEGRGRAEIIRLADGRRFLRFTDFATLDGPDLQVYLLGRPDVSGGDDLEAAGYLSLGALKGNQGDQNYEIPAEVDLFRYPAVSVWCRRFAVNFTTAPLAATAAPGS